jgi:hypothetical protein
MSKISTLFKLKKFGFALVEIMVGLAISGAIGLGASTVIGMIWGSTHATQDITAVNITENTAFWLNRDVAASQIVTPGGASGFPLALQWDNWDGIPYRSVYSFSGNDLLRSLYTNEVLVSSNIVARDVDTDVTLTNCSFSSGVLNVNLTATVGGVTETRTYKFDPRPDSP